MSAGYKDLIGICMRFALVDAMYPGEKPFLILDDPFVNLDDEKLARGRRLLAVLSQDYQVILFYMSWKPRVNFGRSFVYIN